jgi:hypothetical protein
MSWSEPSTAFPQVSPLPPERRVADSDRRESTRRSALGERRTGGSRALRSLLKL